MRRFRTSLVAVPALALAAPAVVAGGGAPGAARGPAARAHAASRRSVGIGDENPLMFSSPFYQALHVTIARYFAPWDVATGNDPSDLFYLRSWLPGPPAPGGHTPRFLFHQHNP